MGGISSYSLFNCTYLGRTWAGEGGHANRHKPTSLTNFHLVNGVFAWPLSTRVHCSKLICRNADGNRRVPQPSPAISATNNYCGKIAGATNVEKECVTTNVETKCMTTCDSQLWEKNVWECVGMCENMCIQIRPRRIGGSLWTFWGVCILKYTL